MSQSIENKNLENKPLDTIEQQEALPLIKGDGTSGGLSLLARVSTLSWDLVIPIVGGVLLGTYIDNRIGSEIRWTLSLLVLGIIIAFGNLYNLYMENGQFDQNPDQRPNEEVANDKEK